MGAPLTPPPPGAYTLAQHSHVILLLESPLPGRLPSGVGGGLLSRWLIRATVCCPLATLLAQRWGQPSLLLLRSISFQPVSLFIR